MKLHEILTQKEAELRLDEKAEDGVIGKLKYIFIVGDKENANKRTYSSSLLSKAISDFGERLKEKNFAGQLNHPSMSSHTELDKISHVICHTAIRMNLWCSQGKKPIPRMINNSLKYWVLNGNIKALKTIRVKRQAAVSGYS
jgi:hypothetical protein